MNPTKKKKPDNIKMRPLRGETITTSDTPKQAFTENSAKAKAFKGRNMLLGVRAASIFLTLVLFLGIIAGIPFSKRPAYNGRPDIIAHAAGGIYYNGKLYSYTNSEEAFVYNYGLGARIFELDFAFSKDGFLVGSHEWEKKYFGNGYGFDNPMTLSEYQNHKLAGIFSGLTFDRLLELMEEYEDFSVVLDTKETDYDKFFRYIENAFATRPNLKERFIPQLYNLEMYELLEEISAYPAYILTLYKLGTTQLFTLGQIKNYPKITVITMPEYQAYLANLNIFKDRKIWIHTINSPKTAKNLYKSGVCGIYTDILMPQIVELY